MLHLELQPEIEARITADAQRRGLSIAQLTEEMASAYALDKEALTAVLDDIAAGRTRPAGEVFAELHEQGGIEVRLSRRAENYLRNIYRSPPALASDTQAQSRHPMKLPYRSHHPNPGILTYELVGPPDRAAIILEFGGSPHRYLYDADNPGPTHVAAMIRLAEAGTGLTTYVNQHVRDKYAAKLP